MTWEVRCCDVLEGLRILPDDSIQCVVTSPPYWGLRDYGVEGQLGLEPTPEAHVEAMVAVFAEVRRVLRPDGTLWLNYGDSYAAAAPGARSNDRWPKQNRNDHRPPVDTRRASPALKPKDLVGMPWRIALALQADGWWLRSDIVWHKPNPMPESVTDRPTKSHEYVFLLTKSERYLYDAEAVKEPASTKTHARQADQSKQRHGAGVMPGAPGHRGLHKPGVTPKSAAPGSGIKANESTHAALAGAVAMRGLRTVWSILTEPFPEAHFATFPKALVEPCIRAGTSEKGCCADCDAPWARVLDRTFHGDRRAGRRDLDAVEGAGGNVKMGDACWNQYEPPRTSGWEPSCACGSEVQPCIVLDPFAGSGTTGLVALRLGRRFLGLELNPDYADLSRRRITDDAPLFNTPAHAAPVADGEPHICPSCHVWSKTIPRCERCDVDRVAYEVVYPEGAA